MFLPYYLLFFPQLSLTAPVLTPGDTFTLSQSSPLQSFSLLPTSPQYWYIEVHFPSNSLPIPAILSADSQEIITLEDVKNAEYVDYTAWYMHKTFHYIVLPLVNVTKLGGMHVAVYVNLTGSEVEYTMAVQMADSLICMRNCSNHGVCVSGKCACDPGYGDSLCDLRVLDLSTDQSFVVTADQKWYLQTTDVLAGNTVKLEWSDGRPVILTKNLGCRHFTELPNEWEYTDKYLANQSHGSYYLPGSTPSCTSIGFWTIRVSQSTLDPVAIYIHSTSSLNSSDGVDIMIIVIAVVGSLVGVAWIGFISWKVYRRVYRRHQALVTDYSSAALQKMKQICPSKPFSKLPSTLSINPCPICLEDFTPKSIVRVLPCNHIYHQNCIDQWFVRNQNCCFCKGNIFEVKNSSEMQVNETTLSALGGD